MSCAEYEVCRLTPVSDDPAGGSGSGAARYMASCVCRDEHCDAVMTPVCASDGRSYDSECRMRRHSCAVKQHIHVRSHGLCGSYSPSG